MRVHPFVGAKVYCEASCFEFLLSRRFLFYCAMDVNAYFVGCYFVGKLDLGKRAV